MYTSERDSSAVVYQAWLILLCFSSTVPENIDTLLWIKKKKINVDIPKYLAKYLYYSRSVINIDQFLSQVDNLSTIYMHQHF